MNPSTLLSACRTYRYTLWREWIGGAGYTLLLGLNPSDADETLDDPTIRREVSFAKAWGFAGLAKWNLFGFRTPYPRDLKLAADPIGPDNDRHLLQLAQGASLIVACWGDKGSMLGRNAAVLKRLQRFDLHCLGLTRAGHPRHPLYLKADLKPELWMPARRP
jgi:hypothetical protein